MTRKARLLLLTGILVVAVGAAVGVSLTEQQREEIQESGETSLSFHKDGSWSYDEDAAFPVDGEKVQELLDQFAQLRAAFVIQDVTDYAQYGLEDLVCTIGITAGDTNYEILVGSYSEMDSQRYLSLGDGNVYLVNEDPMDVYEATLDDFLLNDEIPVFTDVESVSFTGAENQTVRRDENGDSYREEDDYYLDGDKLDGYLSHLSALGLNSYATYKAAEADLEEYGLDDPELTVAVTYTDLETEEAETVTVSVSRSAADRETPWQDVLEELEAAEESGESAYGDSVAYLRVGDSPIVYEISYDTFRQVMACSYDDLRHSQVLPAEFEHVQRLEISLDGQQYTLTRTQEADGDEPAVWTWDGEEIEISGVEDALTALEITQFTADAAGGETEISLTAVLDLEDEPEVRITLYRADGESCRASVDGESIGSLPRSQVVDLIEAVHAIVLN